MRAASIIPGGRRTLAFGNEDGESARVVVRGLAVGERAALDGADEAEAVNVWLLGVVSVDGIDGEDGEPMDVAAFRAWAAEAKGAAFVASEVIAAIVDLSRLRGGEGNS